MQFSTVLFAATALISSAHGLLGGNVGPIQLTDVVYSTITVGKEFTITYANASGPVELLLVNGPATDLNSFMTIATGLPSPSGSFDWTPPTDLPADTYAIYVDDGTHHNFGTLFQPIGATASASASSGSSTSASTASPTGSSTTPSTTGSVTATATDSSSTSGSTSGSTTGSKTSSGSPSKTSSTALATTSVPGAASNIASPLAFVLLAIAAVLSFN